MWWYWEKFLHWGWNSIRGGKFNSSKWNKKGMKFKYQYWIFYVNHEQDTNKCSKILYHCQWILLLSLFPLAYYGLYYAITYKITTTNLGDYPGIVRISSSGPAAELYPDSLGDYYLLPPDISLNDLPVYKHSVRDDRFIVNIIIDVGDISEHFLLITREISNSGLREFSSVRKDGQMIEDLDWQYNRYPNCETVR